MYRCGTNPQPIPGLSAALATGEIIVLLQLLPHTSVPGHSPTLAKLITFEKKKSTRLGSLGTVGIQTLYTVLVTIPKYKTNDSTYLDAQQRKKITRPTPDDTDTGWSR